MAIWRNVKLGFLIVCFGRFSYETLVDFSKTLFVSLWWFCKKFYLYYTNKLISNCQFREIFSDRWFTLWGRPSSVRSCTVPSFQIVSCRYQLVSNQWSTAKSQRDAKEATERQRAIPFFSNPIIQPPRSQKACSRYQSEVAEVTNVLVTLGIGMRRNTGVIFSNRIKDLARRP